MAPHPEGVINSPLDIYLGHLNFNHEARLSLLINTGINSTSGEGLTINGASDVASGSISAEFNGNISIIHNGIIPGFIKSGIFVSQLGALSTGEDSLIDVQVLDTDAVGIHMAETIAFTGLGVNGSTTGILTEDQADTFSMLLGETSDIRVEATGAGGYAYGVYLTHDGSTNEITQRVRIEVTSDDGQATGILSADGPSTSTTLHHEKNGQITVNAPIDATGIEVIHGKEVNLTSDGIITVDSANASARGIVVSSSAKTGITHTGNMNITGQFGSAGIYVQQSKNTSDISVQNSGIITLEDYGNGIYIDSQGQSGGILEITNDVTGQIQGGNSPENAGGYISTPFTGSVWKTRDLLAD
ncbi:hypothetical protein [Escherichia fergusonii]|uniref:hypothetical protein n=1 Tax=Escherichia fergusonii TaxID=564 RepID=UPI001EB6090A|nr:hypothetical protein [Escherichia fergusonii]EHJ4136050.1 hypothetical protein [Escherichia fergusonii]